MLLLFSSFSSCVTFFFILALLVLLLLLQSFPSLCFLKCSEPIAHDWYKCSDKCSEPSVHNNAYGFNTTKLFHEVFFIFFLEYALFMIDWWGLYKKVSVQHRRCYDKIGDLDSWHGYVQLYSSYMYSKYCDSKFKIYSTS